MGVDLMQNKMSIKIQQVVHLVLKVLPYDVKNSVNSFLFYDLQTGIIRSCKKKINKLFRVQDFTSSMRMNNIYNFTDRIASTMCLMREREINSVSRLTYTCQNVGWMQGAASSIYIVVKEDDRAVSFWSGFCGECGDYTYMPHNENIIDAAGRDQCSATVDVLCLCGLDDLVQVGTRRRPYPLGRVIDWYDEE